MTATTSFSNSTTARDGPLDNPSITLAPLPSEFDDIPKENLECYNSWASAVAINVYITWEIDTLAPWVELSSRTTMSSIFPWEYLECSTTYTGSRAMLCDGFTRNYFPTENTICTSGSFFSTSIWKMDYTRSSPSWLSSWSTVNLKPYPACTPAPGVEKVCYRFHSAYNWRTSQAATSASITQSWDSMI